MSENKKKIRIIEVMEHGNGSPEITFTMDFGEYGIQTETRVFEPGILEENIKYFLRNHYREKLNILKNPRPKIDYSKLKDKCEEVLI